MAIEIVKLERRRYPTLRFIGKRYSCDENFAEKWREWREKRWFDALETLGDAAASDGSHVAVKRIQNGELEYWIGMFFAAGAEAPDGYDAVEISAQDYAVFQLCDSEASIECASFETHMLCLKKLENSGLRRKEDDWCFEQYHTPDARGNIMLDYGISIEG